MSSSRLYDKLSFKNYNEITMNDLTPDAINYTDENGVTPLHRACLFHSRRYIELLLDHGADLNKPDLLLDQTPFHYACTNTHGLTVDDFAYLAAQGILWKRDRYGKTPRDLAIETQTDPAILFFFNS
jgi:ankyrin repeat protein